MKTLIRASVIALALGLPAATVAQAGGPYGHHHHRSDIGFPGIENLKTVAVEINERVRNKALPLRSLLGIDQKFRGYRLQKVVVHLKPRGRADRLSLVADGMVVDSEKARHKPRVVLRPHTREVFGHTLRRLQLAVDGKAFIKSIQVHMRPIYGLHDPIEPQSWNGWLGRQELSRRLGAEFARILVGRARYGF